MGGTDLEKRSDLTLCQPGSLPPLLEFSWRGNDSRAAFRAMRNCDSAAAGLHDRVLAHEPLKAKGRTRGDGHYVGR